MELSSSSSQPPRDPGELLDGWNVPIHASLLKPVLIWGAEYKLVYANLLGTFLLMVYANALMDGFLAKLGGVAIALAIGGGVHAWAVWLAKVDPVALKVYNRSRIYRDYYPAVAHLHPRTWRDWLDRLPWRRGQPVDVVGLVPWEAAVAPQVVWTKQETLLAAWEYTAPDLETSTRDELQALALGVHEALKPLGSDWCVHVDSLRVPSVAYPEGGAFPDPVSKVLEDLRRERYQAAAAHYETRYVLSVAWAPPSRRQQKFAQFFYTAPAREPVNWKGVLSRFEKQLARIESSLGARLSLRRLAVDELLSHCHGCVTGKYHPLQLPGVPMYISQVFKGVEIHGGFTPRVGDQHLRVLSIDGYPRSAHPGITDFLHQLPVAYRWSTRWLPKDRAEGEKFSEARARDWYGSRFNPFRRIGALSNDSVFERLEAEQTAKADRLAMYQDALMAAAIISGGDATLGEVSHTILLMDPNEDAVEHAAQDVMRRIAASGFACRLETVNAMDAWVGTWPGSFGGAKRGIVPNLRRFPMHDLNLTHLLPLTSEWSGRRTSPCPYYPPSSPPSFIAATTGATPFRAHLHVGDVGHGLIVGPTGAGKSVLLAFHARCHRRFEGSQVFLFDRGYSSLPLTRAVGGDHYDLAVERSAEGLGFAPVSRVDEPAERAWAAGWLAALFELNGVAVEPADLEDIRDALRLLAEAPPIDRTLTGLVPLLQRSKLRQAIQNYTLAGDYGGLLDAPRDSLADSSFQVFELSRLLEEGPRIVAPCLAYLFHRISERFTGAPALVLIDEAWAFLMHTQFAAQIRQWLKEARKKNAAVILATQSLTDVEKFPDAQAIFEACPTRVYLPNPEALAPRGREGYRALGLNEEEIRLIGTMTPKRDYYWTSPDGRRRFDLELGQEELAFVGVSDEAGRRQAQQLVASWGDRWPIAWLRERGLSESAERLEREFDAWNDQEEMTL